MLVCRRAVNQCVCVSLTDSVCLCKSFDDPHIEICPLHCARYLSYISASSTSPATDHVETVTKEEAREERTKYFYESVFSLLFPWLF